MAGTTGEKVKGNFLTAYYEGADANMKATFLTTLYGTDTLKSEGVAVEFTTSLIETPEAINVPAIAITALFTEHPFPWMCGEVVPSAYCWKLELQNGKVMGFTSNDEDLFFDGVTYEAATGFEPSVVDTTADMSVDNLDVEGMLSDDRITEDDIAAGLYDFAKMTIYLVNWQDLNLPKHIIRRGTIGQITNSQIGFTAEVRGMMESYQQTGSEVYQKLCRAQLGDSECKIDLAAWQANGVIEKVYNAVAFDTSLVAAAGLFDYGVITFTSGKNNNAQVEVVTQAATGKITLYLPAPYCPAVGDTFIIVAGCDKNFSTCTNKFQNRYNFRGEPYVPGTDYTVSYPAKGAANTAQTTSESKRGG